MTKEEEARAAMRAHLDHIEGLNRETVVHNDETSLDNFVVTEGDTSPYRRDGTCFYCRCKVGEYHDRDCQLIKKKIKVRMVVEYEIEDAGSTSKEDLEFHRNDGGWCSSNALDELRDIASRNDGCLCGHVTFEYLHDTSKPYLKDRG